MESLGDAMERYIPQRIIEQSGMNPDFMQKLFVFGHDWIRHAAEETALLTEDDWKKIEALNFFLKYRKVADATQTKDTDTARQWALAAWYAGKKAAYNEMDTEDKERADNLPWGALAAEHC